jgi:hypothetical protein
MYYHIYTSKRKVLLDISEKLRYDCNNDFKYFDILVFKHKGDHTATKPNSFEELESLLKDTDKVYSFNRVETNLHGAIGYDIVLDE